MSLDKYKMAKLGDKHRAEKVEKKEKKKETKKK